MYKQLFNDEDKRKYPLIETATNQAKDSYINNSIKSSINGYLLNKSKLIYTINYNNVYEDIFYYFHKQHWFKINISSYTDTNYSSDYGFIKNNYLQLIIEYYQDTNRIGTMHHNLPISSDDFTYNLKLIPIKSLILKDIYFKMEPFIYLYQLSQ